MVAFISKTETTVDYEICIAGSENIISNLSKYSPVNGKISYRDGIYLYRVYGNHKVIKFMKWLYKDKHTHLNRKYDKYFSLLSIYPDETLPV